MPPEEPLVLPEDPPLVDGFAAELEVEPLEPATLIEPFIPRPLWPSIGQYHV